MGRTKVSRKICSECEIEKDISSFSCNGKRRICDECLALQKLDNAFKKCGICKIKKPMADFTFSKKGWRRSECTNCRSWMNVKRHFQITKSEYLWLWNLQQGMCALCLRPEYRKNIRLSIDHDHKVHLEHSDRRYGCKLCIRGLICSVCNYMHLPYLERNAHLQNDFVKQYLQSRPFASIELPSIADETRNNGKKS